MRAATHGGGHLCSDGGQAAALTPRSAVAANLVPATSFVRPARDLRTAPYLDSRPLMKPSMTSWPASVEEDAVNALGTLPARELAGQVLELVLHRAEHAGDAVDEALDDLLAGVEQQFAQVAEGREDLAR